MIESDRFFFSQCFKIEIENIFFVVLFLKTLKKTVKKQALAATGVLTAFLALAYLHSVSKKRFYLRQFYFILK